MKILNVSVSLDMRKGGGYAERTFQMTRFLVKKKIKCEVLTFSLDLEEDRIHALLPAKVIALSMLSKRFNFPLNGWIKAFKAVRETDIVHLMGHWYIINVITYLAIRLYNKPYVVCPAGALPLFGRSKKLKRLFNFLVGLSMIKNAQGWIAVTEDEKDHFESYGVVRSQVTVIPNGVVESDFLQGDEVEFRKRYGLSEVPVILFMGRLNLIKGPDLLLEAYIQAKEALADFQLVFAGPDEGLLDSLVKTAEENGLSDKIHFVGYLDASDKSVAYRMAHLLVIPSRQEAMSIVALEAGICGLPVLLTDQCGFSEIKEISPLLEVVVSSEAISSAIVQILTVEDLALIKEKWRSFVQMHYSWDSIIEQYLGLFNRVLSARGH